MGEGKSEEGEAKTLIAQTSVIGHFGHKSMESLTTGLFGVNQVL